MNRVTICRAYDADGLARAAGARVLVDRVWPRGVAKDALRLDLWARDAAPSPALRRWFGHDPARWEAFRDRYRAELDSEADTDALRALLRAGPVVLIYGARDEERNQAVVLRDWLTAR